MVVKFSHIVAALAANALLASPAAAAMLKWTVSEGGFSDGGAFSGTFVYDTDTGMLSDWNLTTSDAGVGFLGGTYTDADFTSSSRSTVFLTEFSYLIFDGPTVRQASLTFTNFNAAVFTPHSPLTGQESIGTCSPFGCGGMSQFREISFGVARPELLQTGVPEPAIWATMIGGFGFAGGAVRRRRADRLTVRFA